MPTPPYAQLTVTVNGGAPQTGRVVCDPGDTVQIGAVSTLGWTSAPQYQVYGYPLGWAAPSGWTTDSSGNIVSTASPPASFALPGVGSLWGKWLLRLIVNNASVDPITGGGVILSPGSPPSQLVDVATMIEIVSPTGLHDLGNRENAWVADQQANLRTLSSGGGTGAGGSIAFSVDPVTGQWRAKDSTGVVTTLTYGSKVAKSGPNGDLT